jgi:hypothetical protein
MKPIRDELPNRATPRDHLDEVRLVVRLTGSPAHDRETTTGGLYALWSGPIAVPLEDAARYASAVAWDEEREIFEPFIANQKYTQFEWGASGYALEFAIELLKSTAVETIMLGMGYAIAKIRGRRGKPNDQTLDTEALATDVVRATAAIFEVDRDDLEVIEVELERRTATIVMKGDGRRFSASVKRLDTGDPVVVVRRVE